MNHLTPHQRGLLMTIIGVIIVTPDALLVRLVEADHWVLLFWRSFFAAASFFILSACIDKINPFKVIAKLDKYDYWCALLFAGSNTFFVLSIINTSAANTLVILASMPFIGAVLTVALTGKNIHLKTWVTIFLSMIGIAVVFWGRFGEGSIVGDFYAVLTALCMAGTLVIVNIKPTINTLIAVGMGAALSALIGLLIMLMEGSTPFDLSGMDMTYLLINGGIVFPISMALITFGPKLISAPEVSLIMLLETVLGPLWVWLVLSEQPPQQTFIGGAIVISAVLINAILSFKSSSRV